MTTDSVPNGHSMPLVDGSLAEALDDLRLSLKQQRDHLARPPAPSHTPCGLPHHRDGARVCWRQGFQFRRGTVVEHLPDRRFIRIKLDDGSVQSMPCGGVAAL